MAMKIGAGIALDGEKEFKQAIKDINKDMAVLGSELGKVSEQFKGSAGSMESLTSKQAIYNKQIDEHKKKIEAIKEALANSAKEYGENDKRTKDWQISLNKAERDLAKTENSLRDTTQQIDQFGKEAVDTGKEVETAGKQAKKSGDEAEKGESGWSKIGKGLAEAGKMAVKAVAALGAATAAAGAAALKMATDVGKVADDLITLSNQTGISTEQLQEWDYAMRFIDVPMETMTKSMAKLVKSMDAAQKGSKDSVEAFESLGVSWTDSAGNLRGNQEVFNDLIDALGKVENETERDAMAMRLFGRSAQELNPLIKAGGEELAKLSQEAHEMGAVMSDDMVAAAGDFDDQMQRMDASMMGLKNTIGVAVIPAFTDLVGGVTKVIPAITDAIKTGDWTSAGKAVTDGISGLLGKVTESLPGLATMAATIIGGIAGALTEAIPLVVPPLIDATIMLLDTLVTVIIDNGPMLIQTGIDAIVQLVDGFVDALPHIIDAALVLLMALIDALLDALPKLIPAAIKIIVALAEGIIGALPKLVDKIPQIIDAIVGTLMDNLSLLIEAAIKIIMALVAGLLQSIPKLVAAVPLLISAIVKGFLAVNWGELGKNIISGIGTGIKNSVAGLVDSVKEAGKKVLDSAKNFFGIKSPSKLFEDEIGFNIGAGMAEGIKKSTSQIDKAMSQVNTHITADVRGYGGGYGTAVSNIYMDSVLVATGTGRAQYRRNAVRARALGVVPA